jgi:hypothetical protein
LIQSGYTSSHRVLNGNSCTSLLFLTSLPSNLPLLEEGSVLHVPGGTKFVHPLLEARWLNWSHQSQFGRFFNIGVNQYFRQKLLARFDI